MRIVQVGPHSDQIGGITTHVRALSWLLEDRGMSVVHVPGPRGTSLRAMLGVPGYLIRFGSAAWGADLVHVHGSKFAKLALGGIAPGLASATHTVLSLHTGAIGDGASYRHYLRWLASWFDVVVVMSDRVRRSVQDILVGRDPDTIAVCSPFLPLEPRQPPRFSSTAPVITSGLWTPLYRYDDVIDAVQIVRSQGTDAALVLAVSTAGQCADYRRQILARVDGLDWVTVRENTHLADALSTESWACLVRATAADSFGLAVFEAVWAGIPAVATDVGVRPEGVALFEVGDSRAAATELMRVFDSSTVVAEKLRTITIESGLGETIDVYRHLRDRGEGA